MPEIDKFTQLMIIACILIFASVEVMLVLLVVAIRLGGWRNLSLATTEKARKTWSVRAAMLIGLIAWLIALVMLWQLP
jgi:hypothetical protein